MNRAWPLLGLWWVVAMLLPAGCARAAVDTATEDAAAAEEGLASFLDFLAEGDYTGAAELYGGPLDTLQAWNPELEPHDVAGLLRYGCESRLLQCLPVRSIALAERGPGGELVFRVEFSLPDGAIFVRGPCCGATSTEMPDQSVFLFRVQPNAGGGYLVLDLPPYVP